jgi:hypothetical protein
MKPGAVQLNPVILINGWSSPGVRVQRDGVELEEGHYVAQVNGQDLVVWVEGRVDSETRFEFTGM